MQGIHDQFFLKLYINRCTLQLHILQDPSPTSSDNIHRVVWCPYLPDEDESEDENSSKLLVLTHGNKGICSSCPTSPTVRH